LHAGEVEGAFPKVALEGRTTAPVPVKVAKPFAMLGIGKMFVGPIMDFPVHMPVLFITGQKIGHEGGDDGFVVGPPKFHVMPVLLYGQAFGIHKIKDSPVFFVPSALPAVVQHLETGFHEFVVPAELPLEHDEPSAFHGMTGIESASVEMIDKLTSRTNRFKYAAKFGTQMIPANGLNTSIDPFVGIGQIDRLAKFLSRYDCDHGKSQRLGRSYFGEFWFNALGVEVVIDEALESQPCFLGVFFLTRGLGEFPVSDRREALRERIAALADWFPFPGQVKPHAPIGRIETILIKKFSPVLGQFKPFFPGLDVVIKFA